jgi:hypothetical protein
MAKEIPSNLLCKDCKHSFMSLSNRIMTLNGIAGANKYTYKCKKAFVDQEVKYDPVLGSEKIKPEYQSCVWVRRPDSPCGPEGKLWAPKHKKDLFKMLAKEYNV